MLSLCAFKVNAPQGCVNLFNVLHRWHQCLTICLEMIPLQAAGCLFYLFENHPNAEWDAQKDIEHDKILCKLYKEQNSLLVSY